jgi:hypothetical protein
MDAHTPARFVKTGGLAGIIASLFGIASFLAFLAYGSSPDTSASVEDITNYLIQGRTSIVASTVLLMLCAVCLCCFVAVVADMVREREGGGPLPGLLILGAALMVSLLAWDNLPILALSFTVGLPGGAGDGSAIRALYALAGGIIMPGAYGVFAALFIGTLAIAALRRAFATRWLGFVLLVFAALSLTGGLIGLSQVDGGNSSVLSIAPAFVTIATSLICGIVMVLQGRARTAVAAQPVVGFDRLRQPE